MVVDARNNEVVIDAYVRYVDTGTVGKVIDIKTEDGSWLKLDKTNLWYLANKVELLNKNDLKDENHLYDNKDIDIEAIKNSENAFNDVEISSSAGNGGG